MAGGKRNFSTDGNTKTCLARKAALAAALCLAANLLLAQAPPGEALIIEERDAQGYKVQKPSETLRKAKVNEINNFRSMVRNVLNGQASLPDNRVRFRGFLQTYMFPMMTWEEGLKNAAKERQDLLRDLQASKNLEAHKDVVEMTLQAMTRIVQDKEYRPAARYNAMLLLSQLNDQEANYVTPPYTLPVPMRAALPILMQQFQNGDTDELKIAALLGLSRHLEWENYKQAGTSTPMLPADRTTIIKDLTSLATAKDVPAGRDAEVHNWMRRRAIEALSVACLTKADADIATTMEGLLKDESNPLNVRAAVATALGRMTLQPTKIEPVATAKELGYLAVSACEAELARAETQRTADYEHQARMANNFVGAGEFAGGPGGMPGGGMPGGGIGGRMGGGPGGMMGATGGEGIQRTPQRGAPGMPAGDGLAGMGGEPAYVSPAETDPKHYQLEFLRRRLRQQLYAVQLGLTGGEDFQRPKKETPVGVGTAPGGGTPGGAKTGGSGASTPAAEKKGVHAIAKPGPEQDQIKQVYYCVREMAEAIEQGTDLDFYTFIKDLRKKRANLELVVGKRAPLPGAPAAVAGDDAPSSGPAGARGKAAAPGKAAPMPGKGMLPGKSAARPQPQIFGRPGR